MKVEQTECPEMSAYRIQKPENYPQESFQHDLRRFKRSDIYLECMIFKLLKVSLSLRICVRSNPLLGPI